MRIELKELQRRTGITFVYVTHDQAEALALSDHDRGDAAAGGCSNTARRSRSTRGPPNRMVADFMGLVNLLPGTVLRGDDRQRHRRARGRSLWSHVAALDGLGARRQRGCRDPPGEHPPRAVRRHRRPRAAKITQPRLPRQYQRVLCEPAVRPGVARCRPIRCSISTIGEQVAIEIDATQCSVFRRDPS